ncbi:MAG: hypothetical protein V9G42_03620 [Bacteroidia bacterium]
MRIQQVCVLLAPVQPHYVTEVLLIAVKTDTLYFHILDDMYNWTPISDELNIWI